jgi:transcriptional regulator with XRE-family HTH domain
MTSTRQELIQGLRHLQEPPVLVDGRNHLGPYLRMVRKDQDIRIDDAAGLFGVSVDLLSRVENGKGTVRLDKLLAILEGLGLAMVVGPKGQMHSFVEGLEMMRDERV